MAADFPSCWHVLISAGDLDDYNWMAGRLKTACELYNWFLPAKRIAPNWGVIYSDIIDIYIIFTSKKKH